MPAYLDGSYQECKPEQASYVILEVDTRDEPTPHCDVAYYSKITQESVVAAIFEIESKKVKNNEINNKSNKEYVKETKTETNYKRDRKQKQVAFEEENKYGHRCCRNLTVKTRVVYVRLDMVSRYTPKTMATVGAMISGNFRCGLTKENDVDYYTEEYELHLPEDVTRMNEDMLYEIDLLPVSIISQDHHMFVSIKELIVMVSEITARRAVDRYDSDTRLASMAELFMLRDRLGIANKVSMITHCTYVAVAPIFAVKHLMYIVATSHSEEEYMRFLKAESGAAKQLQTLFRNDLACIYELQVLRNRVYDTVCWDDEISHRVEPKTVPIPMAKVYRLASQIFREAQTEGRKPIVLDWKTYWSGRWSSMPGGSVVSQYEEDKILKKLLPREARIKSAWFSANMNSRHEKWLSREPEIYASTSTKYEWGKVRALYGCDVTSFLHSDFAMSNCEDLLPSYFPVGKRANDKYIKRVINSFKLGVPLCFDYDDFNSQHSTASMTAVLQAWYDVFGNTLTDAQKLSMEWTIKSVSSMKVMYNEEGKLVTINGTLMSGWRLTSFMNTVLNRVYLVHAGLDDAVIYALHNGDDMFATTVNVKQAVILMENAAKVGIRAQVAKTNIGTIGEFLRVDTRAKDETSSQYLARAVATMVHGRVETAAPNDLQALVEAINVRASEVISRGGDKSIIKLTVEHMMKFVAKLFDSSVETINAIAVTHPVQGGRDVNAPVRNYRIEKSSTVKLSDQKFVSFSMVAPGVLDYVQMIIDKFEISQKKVSRKRIVEKAIESLLRDKVSYEIVIESTPNISVYRGIYKAWATSRWIAPITKMRSLGYLPARELPGMTSSLASMIRSSRDPVAFMNAAF